MFKFNEQFLFLSGCASMNFSWGQGEEELKGTLRDLIKQYAL